MTIDKIIFPEFKIDSGNFQIYRKGFPFQESHIDLADLEQGKIKNHMTSWYQWEQEEFLLNFTTPCWIEPEFGWAIVEPNQLLYYSLGVSRTWFQRKPSILAFLRKKKLTKVSRLLSLRDTGEENYFHFYNDVVSKIFFVESYGIDLSDLPVLVSKKLWDKHYFKFYIGHSPKLQKLSWLVQGEDEYVHTNSAIFCKPLTHKLSIWDQLVSPFKLLPILAGSRKVFLTRNKKRMRFIENSNEIEAIASQHGFEVIDTDMLSSSEQFKIFASVQYIIGIHGAGLTNLAFCFGDCNVLELFPPPDLGYLPYHYIMLAKMKGFRYTALVGEPPKVNYSGGFFINRDEFRESIKTFVMQHQQ